MHQFSGFTVTGIRKALDVLGYSALVLPALSAPARATVADGGRFKFHPGPHLDEVMTAVATHHGDEAVSKLMFEVTRASIAGVVTPVARLYLALKGGDPKALFERFGDLMTPMMRGVHASWEPLDANSGRLVLRYDERAPLAAGPAWKGALEFVLEFANRSGSVTLEPMQPGGALVPLLVRWR